MNSTYIQKRKTCVIAGLSAMMQINFHSVFGPIPGKYDRIPPYPASSSVGAASSAGVGSCGCGRGLITSSSTSVIVMSGERGGCCSGMGDAS